MHELSSCEHNVLALTNEISPRSFVACVTCVHAKHYAKLRVGCSEGCFYLSLLVNLRVANLARLLDSNDELFGLLVSL